MARDFLIPLLLLPALTALIGVTGADLALQEACYVAGKGWIYGDQQPWRFLYRTGIFPSFALAIVATVVLVTGFFSPRAYIYRKAALFLLLFMLLGPWLAGHETVKQQWGRPRPSQLQLFGAGGQFHHPWERGEPGRGASFPSGHAAMAFSMIWPYFLLRRSAPALARLAFALGACYWLLMGIARMVQGAHFASDVVWSAGIVYLVGLALYYLLRLDRNVLISPKGDCAKRVWGE
jgi:lipid A 4'-phosphatase